MVLFVKPLSRCRLLTWQCRPLNSSGMGDQLQSEAVIDMERESDMIHLDLSGFADMEMQHEWDKGSPPHRQSGAHSNRVILPEHDPYYTRDNLRLLKDAYLSIKGDVSAHNKGLYENNVIFTLKSPTGNTVLHIAAKYGNDGWVKKIIERAPHLLSAQNDNNDTAAHFAAKAGHISILKMLLIAHLHKEDVVKVKEDVVKVLFVKNNQGNTFFHDGLYNGHLGVMSLSISEESYFMESVYRIAMIQTNKKNESVLYLLIQAGNEGIIGLAFDELNKPLHPEFGKLIRVNQELNESFTYRDGVAGKSPFLAAILRCDQGLRAVLSPAPK
ncbi:hypothetical protein RIF29_38537 [Crotalaria pallida]|uniref:Ankyrin repeat protein n=1 Tax=Crotalaria pallida TaxID=3830 RepID=A0AAN9E5Q2_CROPI